MAIPSRSTSSVNVGKLAVGLGLRRLRRLRCLSQTSLQGRGSLEVPGSLGGGQGSGLSFNCINRWRIFDNVEERFICLQLIEGQTTGHYLCCFVCTRFDDVAFLQNLPWRAKSLDGMSLISAMEISCCGHQSS